MKLSIAVFAFLLFQPFAMAQSIRGGGNPYSSQLLTDPSAGNVQGIQRYGKPLATDPEQGSGFSYFVFPSVQDPAQLSPFSGSPTIQLSPHQQSLLRQHVERLNSLDTSNARDKPPSLSQSALQLVADMASSSLTSAGKLEPSSSSMDTFSINSILAAPPSGSVFIPRLEMTDANRAFIQHQPLVQIKLRVVEVVRNDNLAVSSTLDYIRSRTGKTSEFLGASPISPNINGNDQNLTGASRFAATGLIGVGNNATGLANISPGAGALVNLTSQHLNWIASMLATELEADVLTAPELVTTNGQSVEFVAGSNSPFVLGTVQTGDQAKQNHFFYKHIGSYIKVTPRIMNFGSYGTVRGERPIVASDVLNWNSVVRFVLDYGILAVGTVEPITKIGGGTETLTEARIRVAKELADYTTPNRLVPLEVKSQVLELLNQFSRTDLQSYLDKTASGDSGVGLHFDLLFQDCNDDGCTWNAEDCTIDLEIVARFSNDNSNLPTDTPSSDPNDLTANLANAENGVRAISNIIQIRNDTGLVMAGLLGESDIESVSKIPVIGDLPVVGALFRAKSVGRKKSEILIFIEARILSDDSSIARSQSAADLHLAAPYVFGGTLENPLELGLYRAGFGTYLPPPTCHEKKYWEACSRRVNRMKTTAHDALR